MIYYDQETYGSKNENDFNSLNFEKLVSKSIETRVQKSKPGSDFLWKLNFKFTLACLFLLHFIKIGREPMLPVITPREKNNLLLWPNMISGIFSFSESL